MPVKNVQTVSFKTVLTIFVSFLSNETRNTQHAFWRTQLWLYKFHCLAGTFGDHFELKSTLPLLCCAGQYLLESTVHINGRERAKSQKQL